MNEDKVMQVIINLKKFNEDLMDLNIKYAEEIERLKEKLKYTIPIVEHNKTITKHLKEIERLNKELELERQIKKEVKEYIEEAFKEDEINEGNIYHSAYDEIYQILDKVGNSNDLLL